MMAVTANSSGRSYCTKFIVQFAPGSDVWPSQAAASLPHERQNGCCSLLLLMTEAQVVIAVSHNRFWFNFSFCAFCSVLVSVALWNTVDLLPIAGGGFRPVWGFYCAKRCASENAYRAYGQLLLLVGATIKMELYSFCF